MSDANPFLIQGKNMITNTELVNLLVQTKRERLEAEKAELTAQMEAEAKILQKEGEDILALLAAEATAQTPARWINAVQVLADSGCFDGEKKKKKRHVALRMSWDNPFHVISHRSWGYYSEHNNSAVHELPRKLTAFVYVNNLMYQIGNSGLMHVQFQPSALARQRWKELYVKVEVYDKLKVRSQEIATLLSDDTHIEKRALALLTRRTLELDSDLQQQVAQTIADVLSDTRLIS